VHMRGDNLHSAFSKANRECDVLQRDETRYERTEHKIKARSLSPPSMLMLFCWVREGKSHRDRERSGESIVSSTSVKIIKYNRH
jgi:hypothetical protein